MELFQQLAAVGAVLVLLAASLWWLRRRGFAGVLPMKRPAGRRLECLERLSLGPQHTLHLVRVGDTALLLASTPAGCALVQTLPRGAVEGPREAVR
ncbi:MAG: flagellar biosynthetic protein FliO [Acidobacteriia bacterium]|nr:flagellar biosynthetic protein FliO [Terriglobia bacterium]